MRQSLFVRGDSGGQINGLFNPLTQLVLIKNTISIIFKGN
jgi:hypothetical protein